MRIKLEILFSRQLSSASACLKTKTAAISLFGVCLQQWLCWRILSLLVLLAVLPFPLTTSGLLAWIATTSTSPKTCTTRLPNGSMLAKSTKPRLTVTGHRLVGPGLQHLKPTPWTTTNFLQAVHGCIPVFL